VNASENKKRSILGFTMAEMMGVIAIIVILAVVAFPSIFSMQKDLRMRELDDHAQQIYNAVQNRLSAIKASGAAYNPDNKADANTLYGAMLNAGAERVGKPSDYDDENTSRPWGDDVELYQLSYDTDASVINDYLFKNQATQISSGLLSGSFIIELDGDTDIVKAYEILKGHGIIRGDVPPAIMAFGTVDDVKNYCAKLVDLAMGGGFIIGTGCEVPLNTPAENYKALLECTK
jgi:type II secretory pathway pseudopilin PulG